MEHIKVFTFSVSGPIKLSCLEDPKVYKILKPTIDRCGYGPKSIITIIVSRVINPEDKLDMYRIRYNRVDSEDDIWTFGCVEISPKDATKLLKRFQLPVC